MKSSTVGTIPRSGGSSKSTASHVRRAQADEVEPLVLGLIFSDRVLGRNPQVTQGHGKARYVASHFIAVWECHADPELQPAFLPIPSWPDAIAAPDDDVCLRGANSAKHRRTGGWLIRRDRRGWGRDGRASGDSRGRRVRVPLRATSGSAVR
jgi:hypothetical protein